MEIMETMPVEEHRDRVILVGLHANRLKAEENADEWSMDELAALTETAGGATNGRFLPKAVPACLLSRSDPAARAGCRKIADRHSTKASTRALSGSG